MSGVWVVVAVLALATIFGLWFVRRSGRIRDTARPGDGPIPAREGDPLADIVPDPVDPRHDALARAVAGRTGSRATMVQFSSAFCQPCRATRRTLEEVAAMVPGVAHIEIDAEENLDLVRALDVRRTPTVFFMDGQGTVRKHASGQPRKADVIAALGEIVD